MKALTESVDGNGEGGVNSRLSRSLIRRCEFIYECLRKTHKFNLGPVLVAMCGPVVFELWLICRYKSITMPRFPFVAVKNGCAVVEIITRLVHIETVRMRTSFNGYIATWTEADAASGRQETQKQKRVFDGSNIRLTPYRFLREAAVRKDVMRRSSADVSDNNNDVNRRFSRYNFVNS